MTAERQTQLKKAPEREQRLAGPEQAGPEQAGPAVDLSAVGKAPPASPNGPPDAVARHSAVLGDPRLLQRASVNDRTRLMRQLQRGAGNAHVARVMAQIQAPPLQRSAAAEVESEQRAPAAEQGAELVPGTASAEHSAADHAVAQPTPAQPALAAPAQTVQRFELLDAIANPRQTLLGKVAGFAANIPGYNLLALILGRDPISDRAVERNPKNIFRAALSMVPGGNMLFENLDQSGAIDKAFTWLETQFSQLGLSWDAIKGLFKRAWDALSATDLLDPMGAWDKLKAIFMEPIGRIRSFLGAIGDKVLEFVFEGVMQGLGGGAVMNLLKRAGGAFGAIIKDPIGFLSNLIGGVKQGLQGFVSRIGAHLKKGLMGWLFGELAQTGIELPKSFDLKGILGLAMQLLGMTWTNIRGQAVKVLGERVVGTLESSFAIFKIIKDEGIGGLWEYIKDQVGNIKDMVLGGIKDMVITQVIQAGVQWLLGVLGGPAGALIKAIKAIYDVVMWFVNNGSRVAALLNSIVDSFGAIASGAVGVAAQFIESSLANAIPVAIGFLANLLGLGNLAGKIKGIIEKIQEPIKKGIGWVLGKAKGFASKIMGRVRGKDETKNTKDIRTDAQKRSSESTAAQDAEGVLKEQGATPQSVKTKLPAIKQKHQLNSIALISEGDNRYHITTYINRSDTGSWKFNPEVDINWIETDKTCKDAIDEAFRLTGVIKSEFEVTKWGRDALGKSFPVEWRVLTGPHKGAEVNVDFPQPGEKGPSSPHVGYQTPGKRGSGGAVRGHILLKTVPYNRGRLNG